MAGSWWQSFMSRSVHVDRGGRRRAHRTPRLELEMLEERIELSVPAFGTLKDPAQFLQWAGALARTDPSVGDRFDLNVDLPGGVWLNKPGGVQIAVRWTPALNAQDDNLMLFVYRDNKLVAKSDGIISTAQSVRIPLAENGHYTVGVVFDPASESDKISYQAYTDVEYSPKPNPVRQLLPDLAVRPQRNVTFATPPPIFFDLPPVPGSSCFPSETAEMHARNCLRFDQVIANVGEGPLQLRFALPHDPTSTAHDVFQRVFSSNGSFTDRPAGTWEYHVTHQHYHFTEFALSRLWRSNQDGEQLDSQPVRSSRKIGFCLADVEIDGWLKKGVGPRTYNAPDCIFPDPSQTNANFDYLVQGITPGWADVYEWYLPDQYIEVTGVPDGYYRLETIADPDNLLLESDKSNNSGSVLIRLRNMGTPSQSADLLGPVPSEDPRGPGAPPGGRGASRGSDAAREQLSLSQVLASREAAFIVDMRRSAGGDVMDLNIGLGDPGGITPSLMSGGLVKALLNGGAGNDTIRTKIWFDPSSMGRVDAKVLGGSGSGDLTLDIYGIDDPTLLTALSDGGTAVSL